MVRNWVTVYLFVSHTYSIGSLAIAYREYIHHSNFPEEYVRKSGWFPIVFPCIWFSFEFLETQFFLTETGSEPEWKSIALATTLTYSKFNYKIVQNFRN